MPFGLRPSRHSHPPHFRRPRTFQAERQTEKGPPRDLERGRSRFSEKPVTFARFFHFVCLGFGNFQSADLIPDYSTVDAQKTGVPIDLCFDLDPALALCLTGYTETFADYNGI